MNTENPISRRHMLGLLGAGGAGLVMAGCTNTSTPSTSKKSAPPVPKNNFHITSSAAKLPSAKVKLRWIDSGDTKGEFFKAFFPAYQKKHPNISVDYQGTNWNTLTQEVGLGFHNNTAPDVFELPLNVTAAQAISSGWVGAVDDIIPNWSEVLKRYPPGVFANGVNQFNGKTYGMPFSGSGRLGSILLYNSDFTKKAGFDLDKEILSFDRTRELAKKCTKDGNGKYYGVIFGLTQEGGLSNIVTQFAEMSGVHGGASGAGGGGSNSINWNTGEFNFTQPGVAAAVELILAMKSDGSVFPGSASLDQPGARERFPQGVAAMFFQGPWNIDPWKQADPSFPLGVATPPVQDPKNIWPTTHGPGGSDTWYFSAKTKLGPVIADIFTYLSTEDAQVHWADYNGAGNPPAFPAAAAKATLDPLNKIALELANKYSMIAPQPAVRNPDVSKVFLAQKPPQPTFDQTLVGLFTGQIKTSVPKALKGVQDRYEKSLDDAIKLAKSRGAKVSREDWVFKDWDPRKPYSKLYQK
jgi:multiple sugar transport system substrate-binding protein